MSKDLGSKKEKILLYLAENPKQFAQATQRALGYPDSQYGSVYKAIHDLKQKGYLDSELGKSQRGLEIELFSCTETGVLHALTRNPDANINHILNLYRDKYKTLGFFGKERDRMKTDLFERFFRLLMKAVPLYEKNRDEAIQSMFALVVTDMLNLKAEERSLVLKELLEYFPENRKWVEEALTNIQDLLKVVKELK